MRLTEESCPVTQRKLMIKGKRAKVPWRISNIISKRVGAYDDYLFPSAPETLFNGTRN